MASLQHPFSDSLIVDVKTLRLEVMLEWPAIFIWYVLEQNLVKGWSESRVSARHHFLDRQILFNNLTFLPARITGD